jgi:hypothetical protein
MLIAIVLVILLLANKGLLATVTVAVAIGTFLSLVNIARG